MFLVVSCSNNHILKNMSWGVLLLCSNDHLLTIISWGALQCAQNSFGKFVGCSLVYLLNDNISQKLVPTLVFPKIRNVCILLINITNV